jgi:hypothetical protein
VERGSSAACFLAALVMRKRRRGKGIISPSFFRSPIAIYILQCQRRGWGDLSRSRGPTHRLLCQVMMLFSLLILTKMILGGNLSFAQVAGGGCEDVSWVPER